MDLQLASFSDLDQISSIEKETNEYPWSSNNFQSSMEAGNSSIVLKYKNWGGHNLDGFKIVLKFQI